MHFVRSAVIAVTLITAAACSSRTPATAPLGGNQSMVKVQDNQYAPGATTVASGTAVHWTWEGANLHSVMFDDGATSAVQTKGTYDRTFSQPGTYRYHCVIHGVSMSGTVSVQ